MTRKKNISEIRERKRISKEKKTMERKTMGQKKKTPTEKATKRERGKKISTKKRPPETKENT